MNAAAVEELYPVVLREARLLEPNPDAALDLAHDEVVVLLRAKRLSRQPAAFVERIRKSMRRIRGDRLAEDPPALSLDELFEPEADR